ncbi:hypothetical protein ZWY2020_050176 [Hordeum vulgare]|nr:hypothetical protein ZWY2020_050176 [Hordeum vulgare]
MARLRVCEHEGYAARPRIPLAPRPLKERDRGGERGSHQEQQMSLEVESFEELGLVEEVLSVMREAGITSPVEIEYVDRFEELELKEDVLVAMRRASITKPPRSCASGAESR